MAVMGVAALVAGGAAGPATASDLGMRADSACIPRPKADCRDIKQEDAVYRGDLRGAKFARATLPRADFTGTRLNDANFRGAILRRVIFRGASLRHADFSPARLDGKPTEGYSSLCPEVPESRSELLGLDEC